MTTEMFDSAPQPRENVKIERVDIQPYPDGWRVKVSVDVTPFQERPNLEINLLRTGNQKPIANLSVIETMHAKMEFTIHIRGVQSPAGEYNTEVSLYFGDRAVPQDKRIVPFTISL